MSIILARDAAASNVPILQVSKQRLRVSTVSRPQIPIFSSTSAAPTECFVCGVREEHLSLGLAPGKNSPHQPHQRLSRFLWPLHLAYISSLDTPFS